jgi:hypothetical protein
MTNQAFLNDLVKSGQLIDKAHGRLLLARIGVGGLCLLGGHQAGRGCGWGSTELGRWRRRRRKGQGVMVLMVVVVVHLVGSRGRRWHCVITIALNLTQSLQIMQ